MRTNRKFGIIAILIGGGLTYVADVISKTTHENSGFIIISYIIGIPGFCILLYGIYEFFKKGD